MSKEIITRKQALELGLKKYFTGKPCKHGHIAERAVANGCIECLTSYAKRYNKNYGKLYREINKDNIKQYNKVYRSKNVDVIKKRQKHYREVNVDDLRKRFSIYQRNNRAIFNANTNKYNANKITATPKWYEYKKVSKIYEKSSELKKLWGMMFQVDHIIPLNSDTVCGLHCWDNLQLLTDSVNCSKSNDYQQDW